jgi:Carbohydrate family 9 binding domain-like
MTKRHRVPLLPSERDWAKVQPLTDFTFPWEPTPPPSTELRAWHDGDEFHFRFDCEDHDLVLSESVTEKDRVLGSDRVELFFAPNLSLDRYFCLEMEPRGGVYQYRAKSYRKFDDDFSFAGLTLGGSIGESRYTVTGSVPLATLRALGVLKHAELTIGAYRAEFSRLADGSVWRGWLTWVNPGTTKPDFHVPGSFGTFELEA